jgi:hypothetical protein
LVAFPWLIWEIGQRGGRFDLQEVRLGLQKSAWRTICEDPASLVFVMFVASSFVSFSQFILSVVFWCTKFADGLYYSVGQSVTGRTVRGPIVDSPLLRVQYGGSVTIFRQTAADPRTVHRGHTDGPPGGRKQSAWCFAELLSPLLLESHFHFGFVWMLFLGLVGPL